MEELQEEEIENQEVVEIDLDELAKRYEERSFFQRLKDMSKGLNMPRDSREYKMARIELQRLAAPIIAIVVPVVVVIVLIIVTAISGKAKEIIKVDIPPEEEQEPELKEEEPPPDDIEPPPMEEVDIQVDTPNPAPPSDLTPMPSPPSTQVSVKPAEMESVSIVKSPVKMRSIAGSRNPGTIGARTGGGNGYGSQSTEAAVLKVLWWLKATQNTDGSWSGNKPACTGFALLTYLAHGEYPGSESPYQKDFGPVVMAAVDWITSHVHTGPDGKCYISESDGNEYAFLIATYAMSEAYGMTQNPGIKYITLQMLDRIVKGQGPTGGWDYKINPASSRDDVSFMGWAIQALKAGKMAGLHPDGLDAAINKAIHCLKTRSFSKTGGFTYTPTANNTGGRTGLAGVGTLAMQLLGHGSEPEALNGLNVMRTWQPTFNAESLDPGKPSPGTCPQYYCYYASQCKYQAGMKKGATKEDEKTWYDWNAAMKKLYPSSIIDLPTKVKDWSGKEHKQGYYKNEDKHTTRPVMDTCLAALQLMVYYRYLPTTQTAAGADDADVGGGGNAADNAVDKGADVVVGVDI